MATRFLLLHRLLKNPQPLARLANHLASRHPLIVSSPKPRINFRSAFNPWRGMAHGGSVSLVLSPDNRPRFKVAEVEAPSKRKKWQSKKRLKEQRRREKRKRREANKRDPRRIRPKGKKIKQKFPTAEARIKYKIEKAKLKEAILVERLKKYEVPKLQGPMPKEENLTGEERFYMKKMAQKKSNYVPVGRRGIFGGVILNMHLHWKKHETVKVICKPCKPGQVHEYAKDIARLSGGIPIQIIGDDTIIFYRGKNYVQPEVMSPIDTLSKRKALEKSKYEQSLETVRRFIAISEKELELYYRHVALYGDPNTRNSDLVYGDNRKRPQNVEKGTSDDLSMDISDDIDSDYSFSDNELEVDSNGKELSELEVDSNGEELSEPEFDVEDEADSDSEFTEHETDSEGEELSENEENSSRMVTS